MRQVDKGKILQSVDADAVLSARSDLALHIEGCSAHGDLECIANTGAEQGFQGCVDARLGAVVEDLAVAFREHIDELLDLAQLSQDYLCSESILVLDLELEVS